VLVGDATLDHETVVVPPGATVVGLADTEIDGNATVKGADCARRVQLLLENSRSS